MDEATIREILTAMGSKRITVKGASVMASCPFAPWTHMKGEDRNPSFSVQINRGGPSRWLCYACGHAANQSVSLVFRWRDVTGEWHGDWMDKIKADEGESLKSRLKKLGDWESQKPVVHGPASGSSWFVDGYEAEFDIANFADFLSSIPRYALDRGITVEQAKKWKIGYHKQLKRLMFVLMDETQRMVGWSGRAIYPEQEPKYLHAEHMARNKYLYGECFVNKAVRRGYIMEGFMDVLNLDRHGWVNVLGTMGVFAGGEQVQKLARWFDEVVILKHNDVYGLSDEEAAKVREELAKKGKKPAGEEMADAYSNALKDVGVHVIIGPVIRDKKDPGEWSDDECARIKKQVEGV